MFHGVTCIKTPAKAVTIVPQRATRSASIWPVLQSLSSFVQSCLPLLQAGQHRERRASAALTHSLKKHLLLIIFSLCFSKTERSWDWSTVTHGHTSILLHLECLFIQPQTARDVSDRKDIMPVLVVHIWVSFLRFFFHFSNRYKKSEPRSLSSDLPSGGLVVWLPRFRELAGLRV